MTQSESDVDLKQRLEIETRASSAIFQECPQIAQTEMKELQRLGYDTSSLRNRWRETFDPVDWYHECPSNIAAFSAAHEHASLNRNWDAVRNILETAPDSVYRSMRPDAKRLLWQSLTRWEKLFPGDVAVPNGRVRTYQRFPGTTHSLCNVTRTYQVVWEERLDYANRLCVVEVANQRRHFTLPDLAESEALWSPSGRYAAIIWRGRRLLRSEETGSDGMSTDARAVAPLPSPTQRLLVVDTQRPDSAMRLDDYLSEELKVLAERTGIRYTDALWSDTSRLQVNMTWGYDQEASDRLLAIKPLPDGGLHVSVER